MTLTLAEKFSAVKNALNLGLTPQPLGNASPDLHFFYLYAQIEYS